MKRRLISLLLALGLLCSLLPMALAEEEPTVTALCVAAPGQSVLLDKAEFELLCRQATGHELESVTFSPLSPAVGKLTLSGERLTSDTICYTQRKPRLSQVCFTPYTYGTSQFTGQGEVAFTMTSEKEETVSGTLILYVPEETAPSESLYQMNKTILAQAGKPVDLCDHLPSTVWYTASNGVSHGSGKVTSATFDLPTSDQGSLWLDYEYEEIRRKLLPDEVLFPDRAPNYHCLTFVPADRDEAEIQLSYTVSTEKKEDLQVNLTLRFEENSAPTSSAAPEPAEIPARFQDMAGWEWAMPAAEFLGQSGYRSGETAFAPGENATRMDLIHALALTAYSNSRRNTPPIPDFSDLPNDPELLLSVSALADRGVVLGNGDGLLLPDAPITRQDALVILYRAMADRSKLLPLYGDLSVFSDAGDVAPYAQEAVTLLAARGVVLGDGTGKLDPLSPITRAEMACLLYRAFG